MRCHQPKGRSFCFGQNCLSPQILVVALNFFLRKLDSLVNKVDKTTNWPPLPKIDDGSLNLLLQTNVIGIYGFQLNFAIFLKGVDCGMPVDHTNVNALLSLAPNWKKVYGRNASPGNSKSSIFADVRGRFV